MIPVLLALRFALELCLLAAAAVVGRAVSEQRAVGVVAGVALVAAVGVNWGVLLAPRRRVDLPLGARVAIELALFAAAGAGLAAAGHPSAGVALVAAELVLLPAQLAGPPARQPSAFGARRPVTASAVAAAEPFEAM